MESSVTTTYICYNSQIEIIPPSIILLITLTVFFFTGSVEVAKWCSIFCSTASDWLLLESTVLVRRSVVLHTSHITSASMSTSISDDAE